MHRHTQKRGVEFVDVVVLGCTVDLRTSTSTCSFLPSLISGRSLWREKILTFSQQFLLFKFQIDQSESFSIDLPVHRTTHMQRTDAGGIKGARTDREPAALQDIPARTKSRWGRYAVATVPVNSKHANAARNRNCFVRTTTRCVCCKRRKKESHASTAHQPSL